MKEVNKFFNDNVEDYEAKHYGHAGRTFMTVRQRRVLEFIDMLKLQPGISALDAGCGPGYLLAELARRDFKVSAMDGAEEMLKSAEARVNALPPKFPADFKQGDIEHLPYENAVFDLVCSTGVIEYLTGDAQVLSEMFRILKPGGYLVLPVTNAWSPVNYLDYFIEVLKRQDRLREPLNAFRARMGKPPILPRHFHVRKHSPAKFKQSVLQAGFQLIDEAYFHFLPFPRPLERLAPGLSNYLGSKMEERYRSFIGPCGEGYLVLARKPN